MTSFIGLPTRQGQCLYAIIRHIDDTGVSPTLDEVATIMGRLNQSLVTKQQVHLLVNALVEKGCIHRDPKKHRSITVVEKKDASLIKKTN